MQDLVNPRTVSFDWLVSDDTPECWVDFLKWEMTTDLNAMHVGEDLTEVDPSEWVLVNRERYEADHMVVRDL